MISFLAAVGATVITFAVTAVVGYLLLQWRTSEYDKKQNGGPDLGYIVLVGLFAVFVATAAFFATIFNP